MKNTVKFKPSVKDVKRLLALTKCFEDIAKIAKSEAICNDNKVDEINQLLDRFGMEWGK